MTKPPQPIYNYIRSNDVTLVLYPPYVGSHNAIGSFLTDKSITTNVVYIMSQDIESINSAVGQELPEKLILQYDTSKRLTSAIKGKSIILIDCLSMFRSSNMGINLKNRKKDCHIVIFESYEICPTDEQYIKQYYPSFSVLTYLLSPQQPSLSYKLEQTHMTSEQSNIYLTSDTSTTSKNLGSPFPKSLEIGNFKYPEEVQHKSSTLIDTDRGSI